MLFALAVIALLAAAADDGPSSGVSFEAPIAVTNALADAERALVLVGQCVDTSPRPEVEPAYEQIEARHDAARRRAEGIWGNLLRRDVEQDGPTFEPGDCQPAAILQTMKDAELALDNGERAFAEATLVMMRGAWAGPLKLCQETVLRAEPGLDAISGQPTVLITLQPGSATVLSAITERSIYGPLAIRLDGEVISEPFVLEKIDGGQVQVVGPELSALEGLGEGVSRPC